MPSIDERVVSMSFENQVFEQRVAQTQITLSKLDTTLKNIGQTNGLENIEKSGNKVTLNAPMSALDKLRSKLGRSGEGAAQGLGDIEKAGNKVTLEQPNRALDKLQSKMGQLSAGSTFTDIEKAADRTTLEGLSSAITHVGEQFTFLEHIAANALGGIVANAATKGAAFGKSFAVGPIKQGLEEYQTNLNSIQTILANTQGQKVSGLDQVNKHLQELNHYSDQTIYNFSEMARNIGTFTAAGVDLDKSTQSIKGIANLAALSGSNSQQASTAMYQLSQAIAAGRVGLQDWNSVVNAGMGGAVFQKSLMRTAEQMGTVEKGAIKIDKATGKATVNGQSFRESIMAKPGQESWLTSDVLVKTLGQFTGDLKDADLAAQGFNAEQIKAIQAQAKTAQNAATQVKTLPQVFDVAKETIGSGWSQTFQLIFGNFGQAKKTFTELSQTINGFINKTANARNNLLKAFDAMGGRTKLIEAVKTAFSALAAAIAPIHDAFRSVFPATTPKGLLDFVKGIQNLAEAVRSFFLQHGGQLKDTFAGVFAVLHIGVSVVKGVIGLLAHLLGVVANGSGGFLSFTASIGRFLVAIDKALTKGGGLNAFFTTIETTLKGPIKLIQLLASAIFGLFGGNEGSKAASFAGGLNQIANESGPLADILNKLVGVWHKLSAALDTVKDKLLPWLNNAAAAFSNFAHIVADKFENMDWNAVFAAVQTGLIGGLFLMIRKALTGGIAKQIGGGVLQNLSGIFKALTGNLQVMQQQVKANILLKIATAIGVLAASVLVLSQIDPEALNRGMSAIAVGLGELIGAMALLSKVSKGTSFTTMPIIAASMIGLATAMLILSAAVKVFSTMSWDELLRGLAGVGGALGAISVGVRALPPGIGRAGLALIPMGIGLNLLASAVKIFSTLKWEELAKGLVGVGLSLAAIGEALWLMPPNMPVLALGLVALGGALILISGAIGAFGSMDLLTLGKGIVAAAISLALIGEAMWLMPPNLALTAAGMVLVGVALNSIGTAIGLIGHMKIGTLVKGIAAISIALGELSIGMFLMEGTLPGAAALLAAAVALAVLGPALGFMGSLDIFTIVKGLVAMAAVFGVLALVGATLAAPLAALGTALLPLMADLAIAAAAAVAFGFALKLMGENGAKAVAATIAALLAFVASLPKIVTTFLQSIVTIAESVVQVAPKILAALGVMIAQVINFVIAQAAPLAVAIGVLITQFLKVIDDNAPKIITSGIKLILSFLSGIAQNIGQVTLQVVNIVTKFLDTLASNLPRIVRSGANVLIGFLSGIATNAPRIVAAAAKTVAQYLGGIAAQLPKIVAAGVKVIVTFLGQLAGHAAKIIAAGASLIIHILDGVGNALPKIVAAATDVAVKFIRAIGKQAPRLADAGFKALIDFLEGIAKAIRTNEHEIIKAGIDIAKAIVQGLVDGLGMVGHLVKGALTKIIDVLPGFAKKILKIQSPSKVFHDIGENVMKGLANGIIAQAPQVHMSLGRALKTMVDETGDAKQLGHFLGKDFMDGLTGAMDTRSEAHKRIDDSFSALKDKLKEQTGKIKNQIGQDRQKLKDELGKDNPSATVIQAIASDIRDNTALLDTAKKATANLMGQLSSEKKQLISLADSYDVVTAALDLAQQKLDSITQARDQFVSDTANQFDDLPSFDTVLQDALNAQDQTEAQREEQRKADAKRRAVDQVAEYKKALQEQIKATQQFNETLQQLRAMGLDDQTYQKLLKDGLKDQDFADQLLKSGKGSIEELNKLDSQLAQDATNLAKQAAHNLYDAGIQAAQGLVDGLKARKVDIQGQMDEIAAAMVRSIKRQLGIRSPSRVMMEVGKFTAEGMIVGLRNSSQAVASAAAGVGDDVASALSGSLSHISSVLSTEIDPDLTITPVLDLSQVRKDAQSLSDLTNVTPITAAASFGQASAASQEVSASQEAAADTAATTAPTVEFKQYNTSPEALSEVEIYRQTRNGLSQLKSVLGLPS